MNRILDPRRSRGHPALLALTSLMMMGAAHAQTTNVSQLVTGVLQPLPLIVTSPAPCTTTCQYEVLSSVGASSSYTTAPGPYTVSAWPPAYTAGLGAIPSEIESLTVPAAPNGTVQDGGAMGVARRAQVRFDTQPLLNTTHAMNVQTWKDGSGAAVVTVTIRLTPTALKHHYLEFTVPKIQRGWQEAYYVGGPSGYESFYRLPKQLQTRSAVDVYVDGLPVWSGASHKLRPQRWSPPYNSYLDVQWGSGPTLEESEVKLYLGHLAASTTRTISLIFRTDLRVNADTCYTDTDAGTTYQRCDSRREALSLPSVVVNTGSPPFYYTTTKPDVRVTAL